MNYYKFLFLLPLLSGCFHDSLLDCAATEDTPTAAGEAYVSVSLSMAQGKNGDNTRSAYQISSTRDKPTGGENGDGSEYGQSYENEITTLRVFFFKRNDDGVNGPAETPVAATADFGYLSPVGTEYITGTRKVALPLGTYDVVAVANVTDEEWEATNITTLGGLRDHIQKRAWSQSGNSYGQFVMASADEADETVVPKQSIVTIDADNDINTPAIAQINIERHAARVDYKVKEIYECKDPTGNAATVEIIGAGLVNNLTAGTYMLKRVADEVGDDVIYLGKETSDNKGVATNYVIDPWTTEKNSSDAIDDIYGVPFDYYDNADDWGELIKDGMVISTANDGTVWKCTGYTLENTVAADQTSQKHITGMVFKAQFLPPGYDEAKTFFTFDNVIYSDIESIMDAWWRTHNKTDVSRDLENCSDITSLTDYINDLPDDPVEYKDYLKGLLRNYTDIDELRKQYKLETFLENEFGYKKNADGTVEVDLDGKNTRLLIAKKDGGVQVYKNGICYYTWWIRHSNDGDDNKNGTMEYAIVRNNIYKLDVISISGLGTPIPDKENVRIRVYVRNWTLLPPEELEM